MLISYAATVSGKFRIVLFLNPDLLLNFVFYLWKRLSRELLLRLNSAEVSFSQVYYICILGDTYS